MTWKDELRPASFRGVGFFIDISQKSLGRRSVLHEFPNREKPYTEDMGRVAESFEIEGHVLGDDYFEAKRNLERVFNKFGPGELIHPYYGSKFVQIGPVNFTEATREGAVLSFTAKFFEAGDNRFPKGVNDKAAVLTAAVDNALAQAKAEFDDNFSIEDLPGFAVDSARAAVALAQETFDDVTKTLADIADATAELAFSTRNLVAEVNDLLQAPSQLSQRLLDSFSLMENAFSRAEDKAKAHGAFFNFGDDETPVDGDTPIRTKERENQNQFNNFMKRVAAVKAADTAQAGDYASFQDAEDQRVEITDVIEEQIRESGDTELYQAMIDVNAALVDALPDVDADLPNVKEVTLEDTTASLLVTYDLFEDPEKEQDIIDRNDIQHPGFIAAGTTLEVLDG
jgi:prophage DNA circulation protein